MNVKSKQIIETSNKTWKRDFEKYLLILETCIPMEEVCDKGQRYKAIKGFNQISGHEKTKGIGFLATQYFSNIKEDDWKGEFIQILEQLAFVDGRLSITGNHGQVKNIDNDYLCEQFIKMHLI